jgi:hypothetical protein
MALATNPNLPLFTAKQGTISSDTLPQLTTVSLNVTKKVNTDGTATYSAGAVLDVPSFPAQWEAFQGKTVPSITILGDGKTRTMTDATIFYQANGNMLFMESATFE